MNLAVTHVNQSDKQDFLIIPREIKLTLFLIFLSIGLLIYGKTLDDQFHFDDYHVFASLTFDQLVQKCQHPNRFFPHLSFLINRYVHGSSVHGYHVLNILIHMANSYLVIYLVYQVNLLFSREEKSNEPRQLIYVSSIAGLLFLVHPLATQSVSYIGQRYTSIAAFFYLISLICYINARLSCASRMLIFDRSHFMWYSLCFISAVCAMLSKEYAVTLPAIIILIEYFFIQSDFRSAAKRLLYLAPIVSTSFIIFMIHFNVLQLASETPLLPEAAAISIDQHLPRWAPDEIPRHVYFLSQIPIIVTVYLKLFFSPCGQNIDHDFLIIDSFFNPYVLMSMTIVMSFVILSMLSFKKLRLISFGILWFFITIFPTSSIIPNSEFVAEHRTYLSMIGMIFLFVEFFRHCRYKRIFLFLSVCLITILGYLTMKRNDVWENDISLWQDSVKKSPNKARPWFALGVAFERLQQWEKAKYAYTKSIKIFPDYVLALNNLGNIYQQNGNLNTAIKLYDKALNLNHDYAEAHYNLGLIYNKQNKLAPASANTEKALTLMPDYVEAIYNLGMIYEKMGRLQDAINQYKTVLDFDGNHEATHYNLGVLAIRSANIDIAMFHLHYVLTANPNHIHALIALANLHLNSGNLKSAIKLTNQAATVQAGHNAGTQFQVGRLFDKTDFNDSAIHAYNIALKYNPEDSMVHHYLGLAYRKAGNGVMATHHLRLGEKRDIQKTD